MKVTRHSLKKLFAEVDRIEGRLTGRTDPAISIEAATQAIALACSGFLGVLPSPISMEWSDKCIDCHKKLTSKRPCCCDSECSRDGTMHRAGYCQKCCPHHGEAYRASKRTT